MANDPLLNRPLSKTSKPMTRPAHVKSDKMMGKAIIAKSGKKKEKAINLALATKNPRVDSPTPSNWVKKTAKRDNQSRVARGLYPEPLYLNKSQFK